MISVWDTSTGFCFVTFTEHSGAITGVTFMQTGRALLSSSLDGTVRAFDMTRYRNFRTFTSPKPAQFSCLAVDPSGELVAAGAQDTFDVYLWSVQTGKLLEVLRYRNSVALPCKFVRVVLFAVVTKGLSAACPSIPALQAACL